MIRKTKQNWTVGSTVKVGFMVLTVTGIRAERDGMPDIYDMVSANGKKYEFIPHNGLFAV